MNINWVIWKMDKGYGILVICATILVLSFVGTSSARTWYVDDDGGGDFLGIQEAINNASVGDTIIVHSGVYYENVYVNKSVTLKGIGQPVVDANGSGSAITLNADGITLEGLNATNSGSSRWDVGIKVTSNNNTITGNNVRSNNWGGIGLYDSSNNNTITGNNICNNGGRGIHLYDSSNNNTVTGNVFVNDGLSVYFSYQNTVEDNTVNGKPLVYLEDLSDYKVEDAGQVILVNCSNITVENRDLTNTFVSIALLNTENSKISNNTVCNNWGGIGLYDSSNNSITGNNVSNNNWGIGLYDSSNNSITGNNVSNNNDDGICLLDSSNNSITGNNVSNNNDDGIHLFYSSNNKIYFNNFINNTDNVDSYKSTNIWNSPLEITYTYDGNAYTNYLGNYWDDYEGTDAEDDGIGDTHYITATKEDESDDNPLMDPFENYILTTSHE